MDTLWKSAIPTAIAGALHFHGMIREVVHAKSCGSRRLTAGSFEPRRENPAGNNAIIPANQGGLPMSLAHETGKNSGEKQQRQTDEHRNPKGDCEQQQTRPTEITTADIPFAECPDKMHHDIYDRNEQDEVSDDPLPGR